MRLLEMSSQIKVMVFLTIFFSFSSFVIAGYSETIIQLPSGNITGSGIINYVPLWVSSINLGNSIINQSSNIIEINGDIEVNDLLDNDGTNFFDGSGSSTQTLTGISSNGTLTFVSVADTSPTNENELVFKMIDTPSGTDPVADTTTDTLTLTASTGITITGNSASDTIAFAVADTSASNELQNIFQTIDVPLGTDPVVDRQNDILTLTATDGHLSITGDSATDTIDFKVIDAPSDTKWISHDSYPHECGAGQYVSEVNDTLTCGTPEGKWGGSATQYYIPIFATSTSLGNSNFYQTGDGSILKTNLTTTLVNQFYIVGKSATGTGTKTAVAMRAYDTTTNDYWNLGFRRNTGGSTFSGYMTGNTTEMVQSLYDSSSATWREFFYIGMNLTGSSIFSMGRSNIGLISIGYTPSAPLLYMYSSDTLIGGTATNYLNVESDGTIEMIGDATTWDDVYISLLTAKLPTNQPDWSVFRGTSYAYEFQNNALATEDEVHYTFQMPHTYKLSSNFEAHIHYSFDANTTGTGLFNLSCVLADINTKFPEVTTENNITISTSGNDAFSHNATDMTGTYSCNGISCIQQCNLKRASSTTTDDYATGIYVHAIDYHIEQNTLGSRTEWTK